MKALKIIMITAALALFTTSCGEDGLPLECEYALSSYNNASQSYANQPSEGSCVALKTFFINLLQQCEIEVIKEQLNVTQEELDSISTAIQTLNC